MVVTVFSKVKVSNFRQKTSCPKDFTGFLQPVLPDILSDDSHIICHHIIIRSKITWAVDESSLNIPINTYISINKRVLFRSPLLSDPEALLKRIKKRS
jgi:hypothetical protein